MDERGTPSKSPTAVIAVVDDDPVARAVLTGILRRSGYAPVGFDAAAEALDFVLQTPPDLVILDALMPDMDGFRFLERVRSDPRLGSLPVIMVTSLGDETSKLRALEAGAQDFLVKPVSEAELRVRVRNLLHIRRLYQQLEVALWGADLGTWDWHIPENRIDVNPRWFAMLGYQRDDFAHDFDHWLQLLHPEDRPRARQALQEHLEGRTPLYESEHRMRAKSGEWRWILDRGRVVARDAGGNPLRVSGTHLDITSRKASEHSLRRRLETEAVLTSISTDFINYRPEEVDRGVVAALETLANFLQVDRAYLVFLSESGKELRRTHEWSTSGVPRAKPDRMSEAQLPDFMRGLRRFDAVCVRNRDELPPEQAAERAWMEAEGARAVMLVPLVLTGDLVGFLGLETVESARDWSPEDNAFLRVMGEVLVGALERKRVWEELRQAREQEVEIGRRIQDTLLKGVPPDDIPGVEIAAVTLPSQRIDGDFYDFYRLGPEVFDVVVGDVMGKGYLAALLGAAAKSHLLEAYIRLLLASPSRAPEPQTVVSTLHRGITARLINLESFITLVCARFDLKHRTLQLVDCGHTPSLQLDGATGAVKVLQGVNVPLGFFEDETYQQVSFTFNPGDAFLFYSDGVTEARNPAGEGFGLERLRVCLKENRHQPPDRLIEALRRAVVEFTGTRTFADDFTCVAVRLLKAPVPPGQVRMLEIASETQELDRARAFIRESVAAPGTDPARIAELELAVHETVCNVIFHAYQGRPEGRIRIEIRPEAGQVQVRISHQGGTFDPDRVPPPSLDGAGEGGYGIFIVNQYVDRVEYRFDEGGEHHILLTKRW